MPQTLVTHLYPLLNETVYNIFGRYAFKPKNILK